MNHRTATVLLVLFLLSFQLHCQVQQKWKAQWIHVPHQPGKEFGVYLFRKSIDLEIVPSTFIIHVSADNRYKLYVNTTLVSLGPARGDLFHWNYETVDIARYLKPGKNIVAALVWNEGELKPLAQISDQTAFVLQGNSTNEAILNTDASWKCLRDSAFQQLRVEGIYGYYAAGPGEFVIMKNHPRDWNKVEFNDAAWENSATLFSGLPKGAFDWAAGWMLIPSPLPAMELQYERLVSLRKAEGIQVPPNFPASKISFKIPANKTVTLLLDQSHLTNAYFTLIMSKGNEAEITVKYAESLYEADNNKGNRNIVEGKRFVGYKDKIISDGNMHQEFTSRWWRTYRYVELSIATKDEALTIDDIYGTFTGYPFKNKAVFQSDDKSLNPILDIGWRTARLCAVETYMDCPYYEQLQYVGDTRIQALVSLYNSGDDKLMRNAICQMDNSRLAEGITFSRYPTSMHQEIPPFSLWWIGMLRDYWWYRNDVAFVKDKLQGMRAVLSFFNKYQQSDGSLQNPPYWNFSDWCRSKGWYGGVAPIGMNGNSSVLDLQLLWAYQIAAELETNIGMKEYADQYSASAEQLKNTIQKTYWDNEKNLYADTPEKNLFSQHANALAILTGVASDDRIDNLAAKLLNDTSMVQASIYFKYYVHRALIKAGRGNEYISWLGKWRENIDLGLTTWAEMSDVSRSRSDCHAWGASPNIEFYRTVLGIESDAPGFQEIKIEPHLGNMKMAKGEMPHPNGVVQVSYILQKKKWNVEINLPTNTKGKFIWQGKATELVSGKNVFVF
ncbi:MAG TPA: alpha-L-rhamnosidase C-terminal domain-containing protein [Cyclobacteriaceae bacterium]